MAKILRPSTPALCHVDSSPSGLPERIPADHAMVSAASTIGARRAMSRAGVRQARGMSMSVRMVPVSVGASVCLPNDPAKAKAATASNELRHRAKRRVVEAHSRLVEHENVAARGECRREGEATLLTP